MIVVHGSEEHEPVERGPERRKQTRYRRVLRVPLTSLCTGDRILDAEARHYVVRVHRLRPGDRFVAFDPDRAVEADALLLPSDHGDRSRWARVRIGPLRAGTVRPLRRTTLLQALGKGAKTDAIVRDATELGVGCFVPVLAERSVRRPTQTPRQGERWQRIAAQAARQCGRSSAPQIEPTADLADALLRHGPATVGGVGVCLDPASSRPVRTALEQLGEGEPLVVLVGPEGGLSEAEMALAVDHGFDRVTLGAFVLRTETVCAALFGAVMLLET